MEIKGTFFFVAAINLVFIVGVIIYIKETTQKRSNPVVISASEFYSHNSGLHDNTAKQSKRLPFRKPFIYLTQTEQCLPPYLANSSQIGDPEACNCDVIVLSYRAKCQEDKQSHVNYLFDPNTLFASGRNVLYFAAMDRTPGYHYYIFLDDDVVLKYNRFAPADTTKIPSFRVVEKWLLDSEPAVGVLDYRYFGAKFLLKKRRDFCGMNDTSLVLPTAFFDAIFDAFHHEAVQHILPYPTQYERKCIFSAQRNTLLSVEVKFAGQALMFLPVTAENSKHRNDYDRSLRHLKLMLREFLERIKQEAPQKLRNHAIFKMLYRNPEIFLRERSRSYCLNVTRRQPIIPYRHLLHG